MLKSVTPKTFSAKTPQLKTQPSKLKIVTKDRLTRARRSWNMSRITGKNTKPEIIVRSLLHDRNIPLLK
jgi:hypothetical protein